MALSSSLSSPTTRRLPEFGILRLDPLPPAARQWRNGYFYRYSLMAGTRTAPNGIKIEMPDSTPLHTEYLMIAQEQGLISKATLESVKAPA